MSANLLQGIDAEGNIRAIAVNSDGSLVTSGGSGGGGSGSDASAANQLTEITNLESIFNALNQLPSFTYNILDLSPPAIFDRSGTITTALQSFELLSPGYLSFSTAHLLLQNLDIPATPIGNLWLNFNFPASVGAGSILIKPGETLELAKNSFLYSQMFLLGEVQGQSYTCKISSFDQS